MSAATSASAIHAVTRAMSSSLTVSPRFHVATRERGEALPAGSRRVRRPSVVDDRETPAEMNRRGVHDVAASTSASFVVPPPMSMLSSAAAAIVRDLGRARAVGGEHRLHVVPGRRADELTAHLREHVGDRLGVLAAQRLAGEDHRAGVDIVRMHARGLVRRSR